jgi:hypothetical protein
VHRVEKIDFFARDGQNFDLPQEFAAPSAPIYKYMVKTQKTILRRKFLGNKPFLEIYAQPSNLSKNQLSIGESYLESTK